MASEGWPQIGERLRLTHTRLDRVVRLGPVTTSTADLAHVPARNLRKARPDTRTTVRSFGRCNVPFVTETNRD
jgi:hypothetical protein